MKTSRTPASRRPHAVTIGLASLVAAVGAFGIYEIGAALGYAWGYQALLLLGIVIVVVLAGFLIWMRRGFGSA